MRTLCALLLLATAAHGQCPGDVNGDRRVTVAELVQAVNAALGGCEVPTVRPTATATPVRRTPTPIVRTGCPVSFADDNTSDDTPVCWFSGAGSCGPYRFVTNGTLGVLVMDTSDGVEYYGLRPDSPTHAVVIARWTRQDMTDIQRGNVGGLTLAADGDTLDGSLTGTRCGRPRMVHYEDVSYPSRGGLRAMIAALP